VQQQRIRIRAASVAAGEMRKPTSEAARKLAAEADGESKVEIRLFFMVLDLYLPPAKSGWAGIGTFRLTEGCQWVTEPVLSPLLYKI